LLTDDHLIAVVRAVLQLPVGQRNLLLRRITDRLKLPDGHYSRRHLDDAVRIAVRQLIEEFSRLLGTILWLDRHVRRVHRRRFANGAVERV
jgi:hypothetical protein